MKIDIGKLPSVNGIYKANEPLKKYTWLNVGGPADVMLFPAKIEDFTDFMRNRPQGLPVTVIGAGSNLLVRDGGVDGVVIKLNCREFTAHERITGELYSFGAGLLNGKLKKILPEKELGGLEFISSIPGTIGGLLRTNAGCFGSEISDVFEKALAVDGKGNLITVKKEDMHFSYRHSDFPSDWIFISVVFRYEKKSGAEILKIINEHETYRKEHQPQGIRTAGSTFKNPEGYKAWELIKQVGGCELKIGGACFSQKHCNFLQNDGTATAADIESLGEEIRRRVKEKFGINLEWEIEIIGRKKKSEDDSK